MKVVHQLAEEGRVAIRNIRRDCMHHLRDLRKSGDAGEDEERRAEAELQKLTTPRSRTSTICSKARKKRSSADERSPAARGDHLDGNARWATGRGLGVTQGHQAGTDALKRIVGDAGDFGIAELTVTPSRPRTGCGPTPR